VFRSLIPFLKCLWKDITKNQLIRLEELASLNPEFKKKIGPHGINTPDNPQKVRLSLKI